VPRIKHPTLFIYRINECPRLHAFRAEGPTVKLLPVSLRARIQVHTGNSKHIRVYNKGAVEVYLAFGASGLLRSIPVVGTPALGMPIPAGAVEIFTATVGYVAAITPSGTADLFFTPGEGM
jgi:hypothetical protein